MSAELTQERPERRPHEYYSPERKAEVLALLDANNGNVLRTANEVGINHSLLQYWIENRDKYANLRQQKKEDLDSILDKTVHKYINSIFSHDLEETPLNQKAQAFGIVFDKLQISRSLPTSITQHQNSESLTIVLQQVLNEITSTDTDS
jgi:hypothetical protein